MSACSMEHLLRLELEHLCSAELQFLERLPRLLASLSDGRLKVTLEWHRWETEAQLLRLERVAQLLTSSLEPRPCKAARTLYREADRLVHQFGPGERLDLSLAVIFQRVAQREIAGYGAARTYAHLLGMAEVAQLLGESLDEESASFRVLRKLAEGPQQEKAAA